MSSQQYQNPILKLCIFLGAFLCLTGVFFIVSPPIGLIVFGLGERGALNETDLVLATGIRQLSLGLIIIVLAWLRQTRALAAALLIGSLVPLMDFIIVLRSSGFVGSLRHLAAVPVVVALGAYLYRASKRT